MLDNKGKASLLGEPFGTATSRLRKIVLFELAGQLELLDCYRCGKLIDNITEFSIEHKNSWSKAENPREAFFALANIAFSHLKCNTGAANRENFKIYENALEKSRANDKRKYSDPIKYAKHLEYKRNWYAKNRGSRGSVSQQVEESASKAE